MISCLRYLEGPSQLPVHRYARRKQLLLGSCGVVLNHELQAAQQTGCESFHPDKLSNNLEQVQCLPLYIQKPCGPQKMC